MVDYLDPEIANEGQAAVLPEGEFQAPREKPHIPDYSWLKPTDKLAKYFPAISGIPYKHQVWPVWLYHPTEKPRLIRDIVLQDGEGARTLKSAAEQAKELGVSWRKSTPQEISEGFPLFRWSYTGQWRAVPYVGGPDIRGAGKTLPPPSQSEVIAGAVATAMAQVAKHGNGQTMQADMVGTIVAAVVAAMKTQEMAPQAASVPAQSASEAPAGEISAEQEKALLIESARARDIPIDKRWSLDRLKDELSKFGEDGKKLI